MAAEVAAAAAPNGDFALVSRLQSYGVVTSALGLYNSVKNYTPILSTPLNFAESVAKRGIEVSIPVVKKIDEYTHIDERSVALLDVIETRAAQAKEGISKVNTVAHQPLDTIILALDAYLPANHHGGEVGEPSPKQKSAEEAAADLEESGQARTAITRAKLGLITTHLTQVGVTKLRELQLQGPVHKAIAKQALELVSYSAAVLHLDTLGDSVSQRVADSKQRLFAEAANVSVKVQGFIEQHPRLLSIEKAVEPYALATKSASEAAVLKFITAVAASVDLANHFFANRTADLTDILNKSAKYGAETLASLRKAHPDIEARLTAFVDTLRASLSSTIDTIRRLSAMPIDQLTSAYHSLFQVVQSFEALFASFRQQLLSSVTTNLPFASSGRANPEQIELDVAPTAPEQEEDETVEDNEQSFHHAESHKARRNKKRHH